MCRYLLKTNFKNNQEEISYFENALSLMKKGGPDYTGTMFQEGIAFGHNRLSIIDLSEQGNQPMVSDLGTVLLFNGEIYNYKLLKKTFNIKTKSNSDSEVIIHLYDLFGDRCFHFLDGEFSIVIYDSIEKKIKVVRDRLGIKPAYWGVKDKSLIVSSEIKPILRYIEPKMDKEGLDQWLTFGFSIGQNTMFKGVNKVLPGMIYTFGINGELDIKAKLGMPIIENTGDNLYNLVKKAVNKRKMSDVPIALTLSGGLDSSIIGYFLSLNNKEKINSYTIGLKENNEFSEAKQVAEKFGFNHTEIILNPKEVIDNIDDLLETLEEPIDKGSSIFTYFLPKYIKEKVILIGEGADEIFAGYTRHKWLSDNPSATFEDYFDKRIKFFDKKIEIEEPYNWYNKNSALEFDLNTEIPNFHNMRIDKCFMKEGIEARVPFLDIEVVDTLYKYPFYEKQEPEKKCLREAFKNKIPQYITDRPKKALKFPFEYIVKIYKVEDIIRNKKSILNKYISEQKINELYEGKDKYDYLKLWNIYLFKMWEEKYGL